MKREAAQDGAVIGIIGIAGDVALRAATEVAPLLAPDEIVVDARSDARIDTSQLMICNEIEHRRDGRLFVTTRRLIHVSDRGLVVLELADIDDVEVADSELLVGLKCGRGIALGVALPLDLRASIADARAALQASAR